MSETTGPGDESTSTLEPSGITLAAVTAQLEKHLAGENLPRSLIVELGELCAGWDSVSRSMPRRTTGEAIAAVRQARRSAEELGAALDALSNADHFAIAVGMGAKRGQRDQLRTLLTQLTASIDERLSMLAERPAKGRRPPVHGASVFMPSLAYSTTRHGVATNLGSTFVLIVDACIHAADLRGADGELLDAVPLIKKQIKFEKIRAEANASLAKRDESVKS